MSDEAATSISHSVNDIPDKLRNGERAQTYLQVEGELGEWQLFTIRLLKPLATFEIFGKYLDTNDEAHFAGGTLLSYLPLN